MRYCADSIAYMAQKVKYSVANIIDFLLKIFSFCDTIFYIVLSHQIVVGGAVVFDDYLNDTLEFHGGKS